MLPIIQKEIVERKKWATNEEVVDCFAVGQCTPGVIAVNTATFIGYKQKGVLGGILATFGLIIPPFFIIILIANFLIFFTGSILIERSLFGIRVTVTALMIYAAYNLWKSSNKNPLCTLITFLSVLLTLWCKLSPIYLIFGGFFFGILRQLNKRKKQ